MQGKTLSEYWVAAKEQIKKRAERGNPELPTGIKFLDALTDGIGRGQVWTIAGKSGSGKTSLALQIGRNIADHDKSVMLVSLEMRGEEIASRMFCEMMRSDNVKLKLGEYDPAKDTTFSSYLNSLDFEVVDNCGYTFDEIIKVIQGYYPTSKPDLIIVDFAQLIDARKFKYDERLAITEYVRKLAEMAKMDNIAVILVSQFRRPPSGADYNRQPDMVDMKGSGSLEQLSYVVLLIHKFFDKQDRIGHMLKVAKNRGGPIGEREMEFIGQEYRFVEKEEIQEEDSWVS